MRLPKFICCWIPYYKHSLRGTGKMLYEEGYNKNKSSRGIAWGFGHPSFHLDDLEDGSDFWCSYCGGFVSICTRCGSRKTLKFND